MAYRQLENLSDRSQERVALFITLDNVLGIVCVTLPVFLISQLVPAGFGIVLIILAAIAGFLLTVPVAGMPMYTRLLWRVRGTIRRRLQGPDRLPEQLTGRRTTAIGRVTRLDSPVQEIPESVRTEWLGSSGSGRSRI